MAYTQQDRGQPGRCERSARASGAWRARLWLFFVCGLGGSSVRGPVLLFWARPCRGVSVNGYLGWPAIMFDRTHSRLGRWGELVAVVVLVGVVRSSLLAGWCCGIASLYCWGESLRPPPMRQHTLVA